MTTHELCEACEGTGTRELATCEACEGTGAIAVVKRAPVVDVPASTYIGRPNYCGGRYWNGMRTVACEAQAIRGQALCQRCKDDEKRRALERAKERVPLAQVPRRRSAR